MKFLALQFYISDIGDDEERAAKHIATTLARLVKVSAAGETVEEPECARIGVFTALRERQSPQKVIEQCAEVIESKGLGRVIYHSEAVGDLDELAPFDEDDLPEY